MIKDLANSEVRRSRKVMADAAIRFIEDISWTLWSDFLDTIYAYRNAIRARDALYVG